MKDIKNSDFVEGKCIPSVPDCNICGYKVETCDRCGIELWEGDIVYCNGVDHICEECI